MKIDEKVEKEIEKRKYQITREVLDEFLRKKDWFMWDKKTMNNIAVWLKKQESK